MLLDYSIDGDTYLELELDSCLLTVEHGTGGINPVGYSFLVEGGL